MKTKQLFLFLMLLCTGMSWGQYTVNFEGTNETKTSYASGNVNLSGIEWNLTEALIGTLADDYKNGSRSARMRGYGTSLMTMNADKTSGAGTVSFSYRRYGTDSQVDWKVEYSHNNGIWTQLGSTFTSPPDNDIQTFSETLNLSGNIKIRILRGTSSGTINSRLNIDDIIITDYSIPPSNSPPTASNVTFTGTLNPNETLTSSYTYIDADDDLQGTSTFKWYRADNASGLNEAAISGATLSTYTLQNDDLSKFISFGVVPIAATGSNPGVEVKSAYQGPITDAAATTISVAESLTTFNNTCINQSSASQSYTVSASNLTANLTITSPTHFEISTDESSWSNSLNIVPVSGVVDATTIYVRFSPTAVGVQTGSINHTSTGASTQSIALNGTSINTTPTITSPTSASITANSAVLGGNITDLGCNSVTTRGVEYSTTIDFSNGTGTIVSEIGTFSTGTFSMNISGLSTGTTYYFKAFATSSSGTVYTTQATFTTVAIAAPVATAATNVGSTSFTAQWNAVAGATSYEIDVYEVNLVSNTTIETFTSIGGGTTLSYLTRSWTGVDGITWTAYKSRIDEVIFSGNDALTLRNESGSYIESGEILGNPSNITFDIKQSFTGSGGAITLSILHGASFGTTTQIGIYPYTTSTENIVAPITGITGPFKVVLLNNTAARPTIDNLAITRLTASISYILQNQNVGNVTSYAITGLDQNTTYYYVVRAKDATSVSINSNEISVTTTIANTTWNGTSWSNGAPDNTVDAIIDGVYTTSGDLSAKDLTITANGSFVIASGHTLTLSGGLTNNAAATDFVVANNANILQTTNAANTGNATVIRESAPIKRLDVTMWSSPVMGQNLKDFSPATLNNRFLSFDSVNNTYVILDPLITSMEGAKGYAVRAPNNWHPTEASKYTGTFTGVLNNGDYNMSVVATGSRYYLVGNPYPSSLSLNGLYNNGLNHIGSTFHLYEHTVGLNVVGNNFATYNVSGNLYATADRPVGAIPIQTDFDANVKAGQGFFVEASAGSGTISFTNAMRNNTVNNFFFRTNNDIENNEIESIHAESFKLNLLTPTTVVSQIALGFFEGASSDIEKFDSRFFTPDPLFYSQVEANKLAIQAKSWPMSTGDVFPLGFRAVETGEYTISLSDVTSALEESQMIYIHDQWSNTYHNLSESNYTFVSDAGTFDNRLVVVFSSILSYENPVFFETNAWVYHQAHQWTVAVSINTAIREISVYDLQGRVLYEAKGLDTTRHEILNLSETHHILIVKITTADGKNHIVKTAK